MFIDESLKLKTSHNVNILNLFNDKTNEGKGEGDVNANVSNISDDDIKAGPVMTFVSSERKTAKLRMSLHLNRFILKAKYVAQNGSSDCGNIVNVECKSAGSCASNMDKDNIEQTDAIIKGDSSKNLPRYINGEICVKLEKEDDDNIQHSNERTPNYGSERSKDDKGDSGIYTNGFGGKTYSNGHVMDGIRENENQGFLEIKTEVDSHDEMDVEYNEVTEETDCDNFVNKQIEFDSNTTCVKETNSSEINHAETLKISTTVAENTVNENG